jgi:hypothetical protein
MWEKGVVWNRGNLESGCFAPLIIIEKLKTISNLELIIFLKIEFWYFSTGAILDIFNLF